MDAVKNDEIRRAVRRQYGKVAESREAGCGCAPTCCSAPTPNAKSLSQQLGYSAEEIGAVPQGANMGLGCGNPQAIAALKSGEIVLDLGCGGGFDCFLAGRQIGETGRGIGVDMTPEMIAKARANAEKGGFRNVEFRLGEIENLPVADGIIDVILSNCVINLSPSKPRVFAEAYRVLKPGGRLAISDVVATAELPEEIRRDMALYTGCLAGVPLIGEVEAMLLAAGFQEIRVTPREESRAFIREWAPGTSVADYVVSAAIEAVKPATAQHGRAE
jgi:ubiquinone/menaquinone biosynthesis C-methylase UbiE